MPQDTLSRGRRRRQGAHPHEPREVPGNSSPSAGSCSSAYEIRKQKTRLENLSSGRGNPSQSFILPSATEDKPCQKALGLFLLLWKMVFKSMLCWWCWSLPQIPFSEAAESVTCIILPDFTNTLLIACSFFQQALSY